MGDPITLEMTVSGSGDLSALAELDLTHLDAAGDFRVAAQRVERAPGRFPSRATFRTTIRALHDSVGAVPPLRLSYFDPQRGAYAEAASTPIALDVQPARQVTLRDVEGGSLSDAEERGARRRGCRHRPQLRRGSVCCAASASTPRRSWGLRAACCCWPPARWRPASPRSGCACGGWPRRRRPRAAHWFACGGRSPMQGDDAAAMAPALYDYLRARLGTSGTPGPEPLAQALEASRRRIGAGGRAAGDAGGTGRDTLRG